MKKRLLILLIVAAGIGGYYYWQAREKAANANHIVVSGNLELTQVDLSFKTPGLLAELNVREGDWVKAGQVIARLDNKQLQEQHSRDDASVAAARSQLQQLQTSIEYQQATLDAEIAARHAELTQTQAKLEELLAGSRDQEIQQAQAAVTDATAARDLAQMEWDRAQTLYSREDISKSQYDQARTRLESAEAQLHGAQQRLALVKEGPRKEEIAGARAQVARAEAAVKTAEATRLELRRKQEQVAQLRAEIQRNQAQVGITDAMISDTTLVSPIDGVVLVKSAEAGEVVAAGTALVSIGDIDHPWLRAYINETDLGRIHLGQIVQLSTDSFPDKTYEGRISFISSEAEFTPKQIQTKEERVKLVYRIKVEVDNSHHELKNNMPVDGVIQL